MLSNKVKDLINKVIELYSNSIPTQEIIDSGKESLKEAIELLKSENEEPTLYKVELVHPYTYTDKVMNAFPNSGTGKIQNQNGYNSTQYLDIEGYEYLTLHQNLSYHRGNFYDKDKNFIKGYNQTNYQNGQVMEIPEGAKYFVGGSASSGEFPLIYGYTYNKPSPKVFEHESDREYIVTNVTELKQGDYKTGDVVTTLGYSFNGDLGNGVYDIMTEAEYVHLMKKSAFIPKATTQVDGYGNHLLNNGLVARLRIDNDDMRPEQWGAKGDGVTNDCQALTHMFAKITSGTVTFKEGATYLLGLYGGTIKSPADNPYRAFGCGGLLGGQWFSKPILIGAHNLKLNGNNCLITIPDNCFGSSGMGILNFSGHIENVDLFNFRFDGKGRTIDFNNKNSNHTIFYSSCNVPEDEITLSVHPVGQGEKRSCIENFNIYNNHFFDAGAMHRKAGDWGGDHILIINPTELDGLNIHNNRFEAWGRWVFAVDLGGYGECLKNIKFNNNICIGANAYEEVNEDGSFKYLIDMKKEEFLKFNPRLTDYGLELKLNDWRWRGLGFIDFEARKCFENVEMIGNTVIGSGGWAINGNSRVSRNFLIKDNYWKHVGGGYPYGFELYSGMSSDITFENNQLYGVSVKPGYFTNNFTFVNNHMTSGIRTFGLAGTIRMENNTSYEGSTGILWSHESNNYFDDFIPMEKAREDRIKIIYKNNDLFFSAKFNNFVEPEKDMAQYFDFDVEYKDIKKTYLTAFNTGLEIDLSKIKYSGQQLIFNGVQATSSYLTKDGFSLVKFKKGQMAIKTLNKMGVIGGKAFKEDFIENFNSYNWCNWGAYADRNNYTNIDLVCVEDGYLFGCCEYGFRTACTHIKYLLNGVKAQDDAYICTDEDVYWTKLGGKLTQVPTHKEGMVTYTDEEGNNIDLYYIGKLGKFELKCE
jgi:hypothetical protein